MFRLFGKSAYELEEADLNQLIKDILRIRQLTDFLMSKALLISL